MSTTNEDIFNQAKQCIPGGVNSPVRSFSAVGGTPFFTTRGKGCYLYDIENKQYIDYVCSWGANIVGHANPVVISSVTQALQDGLSFGTPTELEVKLATEVIKLVPSIEKLRLVSSGTEAVMSAIRLARGYTNKKYIIKFNGCYHGHNDSLLVKAGSGVATFNNPSSSGVLQENIEHTLVLEYNSISEVEQAFKAYGTNIACIIIEPYAGNMSLISPSADFLKIIRELCDRYQSLLIYDEIMTGFRVALNCAQSLQGIKPDITVLGKVVGGGMPIAAFGGRADIMDYLVPIGGVYQAGTLSGNPIAVTAGLATLSLIQEPGFYQYLNERSYQLTSGLNQLAMNYKVDFCSNYIGGMFGFYFYPILPHNFNEVKLADQATFNKFFHLMLDSGVFFAPSMFEAGFLCSSHNEDIIEQTLIVADRAFYQLAK